MSSLTLEAKNWTVQQVFEWAKQFGEKTAQCLLDNEVDGEALLQLDYRDFYHMNTPAGPRRKILTQITSALGQPLALKPYLPNDYKPYTVLKNLITPEEVAQVKEFFYSCKVVDSLVGASDYSHVVLDTRLDLPSLEAKVNALFPDMMIYATNFFSGNAQNGSYSGWHTGSNISKLFIGAPDTLTVWVPLQTLTAETGGRLWFYNSEYLDSVIDILRITNKKTQIFQFIMLLLLEKELEANKITEDCHLGDAFMFREINPHTVDEDCCIPRDILSIRLVAKNAVVDEAFLKELEEFPEDGKINGLEEKKYFVQLHDFLRKTKTTWEQSKALIAARENKQ